MEPKDDTDSSLYYWIVGIISSLAIITVLVTTGIFCIRKSRKNTLAFIDDNMQPTTSDGNPFIDNNLQQNTTDGNQEFFNENTDVPTTSGKDIGNLDNGGRKSLFSIYCRSCYR